MSLSFNPSQLADTGFILFVVFTCGYALFGNKGENSSKSKKWIQELTLLQEALRELIGEASAASSNLDRTLQKRKLDLEKLLQKLETASNYSERTSEEFPNDSWEERPRAKQQRQAVQERPVQRQPQPRQEPVRLTQPAPRQAAPAPLRRSSVQGTARDSELARRIEVFLEDSKPARPVSDDSADPAAYKIARRLLEGGKEIHVVAKKVGLPIEEVRVLDTMIKGSTEVEPDEIHLVRSPEVVPQTYSRAKQVVNHRDALTEELEELLEAQEESYEPRGQIRRATTFL